MTVVTPDLIKAIREKTGAGMMDCKKALVENCCNFDEAVDWLRKKGLASAAKKTGRIASEGLIGIFSDDKSASIVEINSETDFVAKNMKFQEFVSAVARLAFQDKVMNIEELANLKIEGETVAATATNLIAVIGENIALRRAQSVEADKGVISTYIHSAVSEGLGKIGVIVSLESAGDKTKLKDFGRRLAMHIAAANPTYLQISDVPQDVIEHEKEILTEQIKEQNRPQNVMEKMIEGRIRKFYDDVVFLEQVFVMDGKKKISTIIDEFASEIGAEIVVKSFVKFVLGEGIEKNSLDFAEEVKARTM